jgi:hypothetical protein
MGRTWADLRMIDPTLDPSNRKPNWCYGGVPQRVNSGVFGIGSLSTCRTWLNMWSLTDSDCSATQHLARLDLPTLLIHADADCGVFPSQAHDIFEGIAATDKEFVAVAGDHYFVQPNDARDRVADLVADWVSARS